MRKLKYFAIIVLIVMLLPIKSIYATNFCTVAMTSSSNQIDAGDTITIDVVINDLAGSNQVTGISAKLNYDTQVFEDVKNSSIKVDEDLGRTKSYAGGGIVIGCQADGAITTSGTVIFSIVMKVKANAVFTGDTTKIELTNGEVSNGTDTQSFTGVSVSLSNPTPVTQPSTEPSTAPSTTPSTQPSTAPSEEPSVAPSTLPITEPSKSPSVKPSTKVVTNSGDNTTYNGGSLPQTGITAGIVVLAAVGIAGSGFAFFKYYQYKKIIK